VGNRSPAAATFGLLAVISMGGGVPACGGTPSSVGADDIPIGLLLSFSGYLAANSVNSERALTMAIEAANAAGGVEGRRLRVMARDTASHIGANVAQPVHDLFDAGAVLLIGPDTIDLATQLRPLLENDGHTFLLPSFGTASDVGFGNKPVDWFVMGPGTNRVACELMAQIITDGRKSVLAVTNAKGYNSAMAWALSNKYATPKFILPTDQPATAATVNAIVSMAPEAYLLAAFPADASALIYALAAAGMLDQPDRWYLSPTLHTPAFLATIPKGVLTGAHGVAAGTMAGASDFRMAFQARWRDEPLDDAYAFYDAGAVTALALARALLRTGAIPGGTGLSEHIRAVTHGLTKVRWNELDSGFELLRSGVEIEYLGLTGLLAFDSSGQSRTTATKWWTIDEHGFRDVVSHDDGDCR
jgi:ABC-type branched-subunit amino acid transport system substrate-binding protein